jgi:hypothetical protein
VILYLLLLLCAYMPRLSWWQWAVVSFLVFVALGEFGQAVGYG